MKLPEEEFKKFQKAKTEAEQFYKNIGEVYCPHLQAKVAFNTKGLEHIKFKERGKARSVSDQYMRLRLLKLAPQIIQKSHTLQDFYETKHLEQQKTNSEWQYRMLDVTYYGFVAIIKDARMKVIVKQVEGGTPFFWSLIPFWKNDTRNSRNKKILHSGDMEND
jgi:hypothetical protein